MGLLKSLVLLFSSATKGNTTEHDQVSEKDAVYIINSSGP